MRIAEGMQGPLQVGAMDQPNTNNGPRMGQHRKAYRSGHSSEDQHRVGAVVLTKEDIGIQPGTRERPAQWLGAGGLFIPAGVSVRIRKACCCYPLHRAVLWTPPWRALIPQDCSAPRAYRFARPLPAPPPLCFTHPQRCCWHRTIQRKSSIEVPVSSANLKSPVNLPGRARPEWKAALCAGKLVRACPSGRGLPPPRRNAGLLYVCTRRGHHKSAERNVARQWPTRP